MDLEHLRYEIDEELRKEELEEIKATAKKKKQWSETITGWPGGANSFKVSSVFSDATCTTASCCSG